jgi:hypothetical protein
MSELILREEDHTYWIGKQRFPSVSEIIKPVCNFDGVPVEILERKSAIGKAAHLLAEWHDRKEKIDTKSIDDAVAPYFAAWKKFCKEMKPRWSKIEVRQRHPIHCYAGTLDRLGVLTALGPERWMIDIKTVATVSPATGLQTAAYVGLEVASQFDALCIKRGAVQLKNNGTYQLVPFDDPADWPTFMGLLSTHRWKVKHGIA